MTFDQLQPRLELASPHLPSWISCWSSVPYETPLTLSQVDNRTVAVGCRSRILLRFWLLVNLLHLLESASFPTLLKVVVLPGAGASVSSPVPFDPAF